MYLQQCLFTGNSYAVATYEKGATPPPQLAAPAGAASYGVSRARGGTPNLPTNITYRLSLYEDSYSISLLRSKIVPTKIRSLASRRGWRPKRGPRMVCVVVSCCLTNKVARSKHSPGQRRRRIGCDRTQVRRGLRDSHRAVCVYVCANAGPLASSCDVERRAFLRLPSVSSVTGLRPISLLRLSLLRFVDSNIQGNSSWRPVRRTGSDEGRRAALEPRALTLMRMF